MWLKLNKPNTYLSPENIKKKSDEINNNEFKLKDFFDNPTMENVQKLKSMNLNEIKSLYK